MNVKAIPIRTHIATYSSNRQPARMPPGPTKIQRKVEGFSATAGVAAGVDAGTGEGFQSAM
jgi:hypothetical protein